MDKGLICSIILQEFTDKLIEEEELSEDQKDAFKVKNDIELIHYCHRFFR